MEGGHSRTVERHSITVKQEASYLLIKGKKNSKEGLTEVGSILDQLLLQSRSGGVGRLETGCLMPYRAPCFPFQSTGLCP